MEIIIEKDTERKYRFLIILALILSIISLSIAFTLLNQVLYINGISNIKSNTWNITFGNLSSPSIVGSATIDTPATLKNNSTSLNFEITLKKSSDSVTYYFDVVNNGTADAKISSINILGIPNITDNLVWSLTYADGSTLSIGDTLDSGVTKRLKLAIRLTNVPANDISLNMGATIEYVQY